MGKQVGAEYQDYVWFPDVIHKAQVSAYKLAQLAWKNSTSPRSEYSEESIKQYWKLDDLKKEELEPVERIKSVYDLSSYFGRIISLRARLGVNSKVISSGLLRDIQVPTSICTLMGRIQKN